MKLLIRSASVATGYGFTFTAAESKEWNRLHYAFRDPDTRGPLESADAQRAFVEKWDEYLSQIPGGGIIAGDRVSYGPQGEGGRLFEDADGRTVRALAANETFTDWGRSHGVVAGYDQPQLSLSEVIKRIVCGSPETTQGLGTPSLGGYLIPAPLSLQLLDLALNQTRVKQAGCSVIPMASNTLTLAKVLTPIKANWTAENSLIAESGLTFGPVVLTSRKLTAMVRCSLEVLEDSTPGGGIQNIVDRYLAAALAQELDRACLFGDGANETPKGVWNFGGIETLDLNGKALDSYEALSMGVQRLAEQNVVAGDFILSPRTDGEIDRLVDSLGRPLEMPRSVASRQLLSTNQVPNNLPTDFGSPESGTTGSAIFTADWGSLLLGMRTNLMIEASRQAAGAFEYGQVVIRAYLRADCTLARESYFCAIRGIVPPSNESPA